MEMFSEINLFLGKIEVERRFANRRLSSSVSNGATVSCLAHCFSF